MKRYPCPTCSGRRMVIPSVEGHPFGVIPQPCPDCTDGYMSLDHMYAIVGAVIAHSHAASPVLEEVRSFCIYLIDGYEATP